jgi:hypothetical protein
MGDNILMDRMKMVGEYRVVGSGSKYCIMTGFYVIGV